jgi:hypothetical protein
MTNRTALAALLLALASPSWAAGNAALQQARTLAGGNAGAYDNGCTAGSCGAQAPVCQDETCRINRAAEGALQTGGLIVAKDNGMRATVSAEVPAPPLGEDKEGSKDKPGFFSKLFSGSGLGYSLGGAAAGAGIGWLVGGPIGAVIGGLLGAVGGFFMSKMLAK